MIEKQEKLRLKQKMQDEVIDRDLILVDDMISTGGSIIKATQFLKKQKMQKSLRCMHSCSANE